MIIILATIALMLLENVVGIKMYLTACLGAVLLVGYSSLLRLVPMSLAMPTSSGIIMAAVAVALVMAPKNAAAAQDRKISTGGIL